jgi:phage-related tail fiber protein
MLELKEIASSKVVIVVSELPENYRAVTTGGRGRAIICKLVIICEV